MSGHSKWHNIRIRKGAQDAKRGNLFTRLAREIIMAARAGGASPDTNLRLRLAIQKARENSMPQDSIKRSVQRGTGEIEGVTYEEVTYEAYGPGGVAILVECATDNRNRTVAEVRHVLSRHGGRMVETGSVAYRFRAVGLLTIAAAQTNEDAVLNAVVDAGAEDVRRAGDVYEVVTQPESFAAVRQAVEGTGLPLVGAEYTMEPADAVPLDCADASQMLRLMDALEDCDDVQHVYANFDIPDQILESASL